MHALLDHLEDAGFDGAPRVVGFDTDGHEILTFIEGDVLAAGSAWRPGMPTPWPPWAKSIDCVVASAKLLGRFHQAMATFQVPEAAQWRRYAAPRLGDGEIVCHGDIGPHNTVYRSGLPVAFIDWDTIRPGDPIIEFGVALWKFVPLGDDAYFDASDFATTPPLAHRIARFATAYGISDRTTVTWALHQAKQRTVETMRNFPLTPAQAAAELRRVAAELEWLDDQLPALIDELD